MESQHPPDQSVAVVLPVFNRPHRIREAVESVLAQDHPNIRVVVVDDCSTDGATPAEIERLAAAHPIVTALLLGENGGQSAARNAGVAAVDADFVTFLDSDDLMPPDRIGAQVAHLRNSPHLLAVMGRQDIQLAHGVTAPPMVVTETKETQRPISVMTTMLRPTDFLEIGGFDIDLRYCEDVEFHRRLTTAGQVEYVDAIWQTRRINSDNLVYDTDMIRRSMFQVLRRHKNR